MCVLGVQSEQRQTKTVTSQNGDKPKRRHAYSKLIKTATNENGDKRKWQHALNKCIGDDTKAAAHQSQICI